jgi:Synergist-CTERM protein sorting domain-containing protein
VNLTKRQLSIIVVVVMTIILLGAILTQDKADAAVDRDVVAAALARMVNMNQSVTQLWEIDGFLQGDVKMILEGFGLPFLDGMGLNREIYIRHLAKVLQVKEGDTRNIPTALFWYNETLYFYALLDHALKLQPELDTVFPYDLFLAFRDFDVANQETRTYLYDELSVYPTMESMGLNRVLRMARVDEGTDESFDELAVNLALITSSGENNSRNSREAVAEFVTWLMVDCGMTDQLPDASASMSYMGSGFEDAVKDKIKELIVSPDYPPTYDEGYDDGYDKGEDDGYDTGYDKGHSDGHDLGYQEGRTDGFDEGYEAGYEAGYADGEAGKTEAVNDAFDKGKDEGRGEGYDQGWQEGYDKGKEDGLAGVEPAVGGGGGGCSAANYGLFALLALIPLVKRK